MLLLHSSQTAAETAHRNGKEGQLNPFANTGNIGWEESTVCAWIGMGFWIWSLRSSSMHHLPKFWNSVPLANCKCHPLTNTWGIELPAVLWRALVWKECRGIQGTRNKQTKKTENSRISCWVWCAAGCESKLGFCWAQITSTSELASDDKPMPLELTSLKTCSPWSQRHYFCTLIQDAYVSSESPKLLWLFLPAPAEVLSLCPTLSGLQTKLSAFFNFSSAVWYWRYSHLRKPQNYTSSWVGTALSSHCCTAHSSAGLPSHSLLPPRKMLRQVGRGSWQVSNALWEKAKWQQNQAAAAPLGPPIPSPGQGSPALEELQRDCPDRLVSLEAAETTKKECKWSLTNDFCLVVVSGTVSAASCSVW